MSNCPLCGRPLLSRGSNLTVDTMGPNERNLTFCSDGDGCRRAAYDRLVKLEQESKVHGILP